MPAMARAIEADTPRRANGPTPSSIANIIPPAPSQPRASGEQFDLWRGRVLFLDHRTILCGLGTVPTAWIRLHLRRLHARYRCGHAALGADQQFLDLVHTRPVAVATARLVPEIRRLVGKAPRRHHAERILLIAGVAHRYRMQSFAAGTRMAAIASVLSVA
jgi:hypothetical protein